MTLVIFILILSILVLIHEFGHFIAAKKNGVRVEEFGLGLPPRIFGKRIGETTYSLNWLPFGGFVRLTGEEVVEDNSESGYSGVNDPRSFASKSPFQRFTILSAGVFMNMVLAVVLFTVFLASNGFKTYYLPLFSDYQFKHGTTHKIGTVVSGVAKDSPAEKSGVMVGEAVMAMNGKTVNSFEEIREINYQNIGQEIDVTLMDLRDQTGKSTRNVKVSPAVDEKGNAFLGVYLTDAAYISYDKPWEKVLVGLLHSRNVLGYSLSSMSKMIGLSVQTGDITPVSQSVAGPVGIYNLIGSIIEYGGDRLLLTLVDYIALMSLSLAFVNILPFPALDGGRVVFVLAEGILRKKINPHFETAVHKFGMVILLALIVLITFKDLFL